MKRSIKKRRAVGFRETARFAGAVLLLLTACFQPSEEQRAKNAVAVFYDVYLKLHPSGVPPKEQQLEFKKVTSSGLASLLDDAFMIEDSSREPKSGSQPKIEGDLFTSVDEGAVSYKTLQCEIQKESAACVAELTNVDDRNGSKLAWKDRLFLIKEGNRWVVDDIEYLGDRPFMHKGHLRDVLRQVIEEGKNPDD
ncbi:MAG TPA: hypothetical protein VGL11_02260 [Candidatus Binatia bacterium]